MNQNIDNKIRTILMEHDIKMSENCQNRIEDTIHGLSDTVNKKWQIQFWPKVAIVTVCLLISSIPVFATVDHVRQRMEGLSEEEKNDYYEGIQNSPANADSYSREYTEDENARRKDLRAKYESGVFPTQKLPVYNTQSAADTGIDFYFVEDTSLFVLPDRELTDEELLEIIDFNYCRDYSLNEKVKEIIVTDSPKEFIEKGGMDEQKAFEMAKTDLENIFGIDCEESELTVEYNDIEGTANVYVVTMTDNETMIKVFIDADQELVTDIINIKQDKNFTEDIEVDQDKFIAKYDDALDILKKWKGEEVPIIQATCEYNYNSDGYLEQGIVNYLFEMEDGTGYVFHYSCLSEVFFQIFMTDYSQYRQRVDQNIQDKGLERGIERKIIQMQ